MSGHRSAPSWYSGIIWRRTRLLKRPRRHIWLSLRALQGAFFYHTTKVGLGVSVKWGSGLLILRKEGDGTSEFGSLNLWSAPVFYKVQCASLGVSAGLSLILSFIAINQNQISCNMLPTNMAGLYLHSMLPIKSSSNRMHHQHMCLPCFTIWSGLWINFSKCPATFL